MYCGTERAPKGEFYRGAGEIAWLLYWPDAPYWPDSTAAGGAVAAAAVRSLTTSGADRILAGGGLPAPDVYGVPEQWPHIRGILKRAGFTAVARTEIVFLAEVDAIDRPQVPLAGLGSTRSLGVNGTRLSAVLDGEVVGYIEVEQCTGDAGRIPQHVGWADVGNLRVDEEHRRQGVASWLLGQAAEWLRLGHVDRLLGYATVEEDAAIAFLEHVGFRELARTQRDWQLRTQP